ncbi:MAG: type II secretion system F family protein [Pseudomonadota bacterium]
MDNIYYIIGILVFVAAVLMLEGAFLFWNNTRGPAAERIARRLRIMTARTDIRQSTMIRERLLSETPELHRLFSRLPHVDKIDVMLQQSGMGWNVAKLTAFSLGSALAGLMLSNAYGLSWLSCLGGMLLFGLLPAWLVYRRIDARVARIGEQLPDALDLMGRAMRAGHAFPTALKMVGEEMSAPLCEEFRAAFDEVNFGISMQDALNNLARRVPSTDLRYFVIAVLIQRETGGNLSELLASISHIIRGRAKLMAQVRVLSAEGRMSAWILTLLPFAVASLVQLTNPSFLAVLYTDPLGIKMLVSAGSLMATGVFAMRRIIKIRV